MRTRQATTRDTIITAARRQFLTNGYAGTTLDEIAKEANTTKRTIYGYFPDKKALLVSVIEQIVGTQWLPESATTRVNTAKELHIALFILARALEDVIAQAEYIQLLRIVITEVRMHPDLTLLFERSVTKRAYMFATQLFSNAVNSQIIRKNDPEVLAGQFVGNFAIRVLLDGLLQPESIIKQRTSQKLEHYVTDFLSPIITDAVMLRS